MIGLLTETIGNPTPIDDPVRAVEAASGCDDLHYPIAPQDVALPAVDRLLGDGQSRGARLCVARTARTCCTTSTGWARTRSSAAAATAGRRRRDDDRGASSARRAARQRAARDGRRGPARAAARRGVGAPELTSSKTAARSRPCATRAATSFPSDQPDFPTATKFVNALIKTGITVQRATAEFTVAGKNYPAGSFVVKTAQAFRPHVMDMFEPQDHPDDFPYPGGPPTRPTTTPAGRSRFQMGVQFDRILDGFDGPFERCTGLQTPAPRQGRRPRAAADCC